MGGVSMEWKEVRLGDVCSRVCSGGTPKSTNLSYYGGEIPWLNTKEIDFNRIYSTEKTITDSGLNNSSAKWIAPNTVTVAMYGATAGKSCIVKVPMTTNQACCNLTINDELADYEFVYYSLKNDYTTLASLANGGAQQNLNAQIIKDYVLQMPSFNDQRRIVSILSSLDRKIELNNNINADLEEMAQAIFKNWFVDFEPFKDGKFVDSELGMIPEGWKVGTLGEFCKCLLGGTPSRSKEEYWNGEVNWINSGEINKFRILEASEKITELGLAKSATKLLPKKTTVLAITGATLGQVSLLEIDTCANQSVIGVLENAEVPYEYIYPFIKDRIEMLIQHQTGGAQQHINKDNVESLIFLLPAKNVLEDYISLVRPMYKRIESQCFENLYLSTLRDTLLPRLMSGEMEVPEKEEQRKKITRKEK